MNAEQSADPTQSAPSRPTVSGEADPIINSILARARWIQRALAPWTQHWLAQVASPSGQVLPIAFTAGYLQQTLSRVHAQYESYASRPVAEEADALPLVGIPPQPAQPAAASGIYSKPFNSLEDFLAAVEARKERNDTPPPPTETAKPAAKRIQGPYSKPFNSLEEFLRATEAAKARNYAPPPAEEVVPPAPPREAGPYAHAFTSFEEFTKAVEESRQQWGYTAPQEAQPPPRMAAQQIRPISRVEELPTRGSSNLVNIPVAASMPQPAESFSIPDQLPTTMPAAEGLPPQPDSAVPAAPTPTAVPTRPAMIPPFSPAKARGGPTPRGPAPRGPTSRETPPKASGPQPVQHKAAAASELPAPVEPLPAASPVSPVMLSSDTVSAAPESSIESALPIVHQQTDESASSNAPATYEMTPSAAPLTTPPAAEPAPTRSARSVPPLQQPASDLVPVNAAPETRDAVTSKSTPQTAHTPAAVAPSVKVVTASSPTPRGQPSAISSTPSIQRAVDETVQDKLGSSDTEPSAAPVLQRPTAESAPTAVFADQASSERTASSTREELSIPAALPLVQRHASESAAALVVSEVEARPEVTSTRSDALDQRSITTAQPAPIPAHPETSPSPSTVSSVVQRQVSRPPTSAVASEAAREDEDALPITPADFTPARSAQSVPLTQRQLDQASTPAAVQRHASESPTAAPVSEAALKEEFLPTSTPESTPARSAKNVPLAQRQLDQASTPAAVQRHTSEPQRATPVSETALKEEFLPTSTPESTPARSAQSMPLAQRQTVEAGSVPSFQLPETSAEKREALHPATMAPPVRSEMPLVQRHVADIQTVEEEPIQRQLDGPPALVGAVPLPDQAAINISDRILARIAGHEQVPAAKLPDLPLHQPVVQRVSAPEAKATPKLVENEFVSAASAPPVSNSAITPVIQRTPTEPSATSQEPGFIQRVESAPVEPGPETPELADLDDLARQVYPIIKHMLAVERERRSFR